MSSTVNNSNMNIISWKALWSRHIPQFLESRNYYTQCFLENYNNNCKRKHCNSDSIIDGKESCNKREIDVSNNNSSENNLSDERKKLVFLYSTYCAVKGIIFPEAGDIVGLFPQEEISGETGDKDEEVFYTAEEEDNRSSARKFQDLPFLDRLNRLSLVGIFIVMIFRSNELRITFKFEYYTEKHLFSSISFSGYMGL